MTTDPRWRLYFRSTSALLAIFIIGVAFRIVADCASFGLPFADLAATSFCAEIAEAYWTGLTNGTTPTTFSPGENVTREEEAAFATRTLDSGLSRGSLRSKLQQFWNGSPRWDLGFGLTTVGSQPKLIQSDGTDIWVADSGDGTVYRVRSSDGSVVGHWTGATAAWGVLIALGRIFVTGFNEPGALYMIDPTAPPGAVTTVADLSGMQPTGIAFDGAKIWTANGNGSVSIITPGSSTPYSTTTVTGLVSAAGAIFDGSNVWITDQGDSQLKKLNGSGAIIQTVSVGAFPQFPAFDGTNIWVPNLNDNSVTVVRASTGAVVATLTGNGLSSPSAAAFDGQRILVTNNVITGGLSLFQATTLAPIGNPSTSGVLGPFGACSDGSNFWVGEISGTHIGRF